MKLEDMRLVSLSELARELGVNKSKLNYYKDLGIIKPETTVGKMMIFSYEKVVDSLKEATRLKNEGVRVKNINTV